MTDIKLEIQPDGAGADIVIENEDLVLDESLVTPVLVALFCDARAQEGDPVVSTDDPRGWWADEEGDPFGSRLWLLDAGKLDNENLARAREWALEALQWLIDDEIAAAVEVTATRVSGDHLGLNIQIQRGTAPQWQQLWDATAEETLVRVPDATVRLLTY